MSPIDELLKNEKVEWKKLGDVATISKGKQLNKRDMIKEGIYPVINGGVLPSGYNNACNRDENTITVSQGGASAGFVNFIEIKFWLGAHAFSVIPNKDMVSKYNYEYSTFNRFLYHVLKANQINLQDSKEGAGIPSVSKEKLSSIPVPLISKKTQEKIVETLDKFTNYVTELQAELQAELQMRTYQYSYYRDFLLSENCLNKLSAKLLKAKVELRNTSLGEVGTFIRGNGLQKKDFLPKGKPVIHYGQIYTRYGFQTDKTISYVDDSVFAKLKKARQNDILMATTSENIEDVGKSVVWLGKEEIGFSGDMYCYRTRENAKYIAYYFQTKAFQKQKERKVSGTKLIRIHGDDMEKFSISLPAMEIQNRVVEILDKFQDLLADTQGLLPKEIEQRQKQYEYYREKLLTFDENVVEPNRTEPNQ
ncbi:Type I restriction enzyme specificity protein MPN_089 [Urinicoccus massiliensis]|uniref:Type I restriction enzyme specificity protein MPN_089 n=1 Tax=Urinicoccus massiliensis TaxID=1723382 RepID=A0A8H2M472_9FIRM|nr:restriction endonuclease subunit S [Urinicoccus massiliensis]VFB15593.1 Type I restriction enzyme specificity protein MPN_089 [Urinicoccus massiliensis]